MSYTIAIAGKGGTGKTTIAALLIRLIKEKKLGSCLAVDADPNSNLGEALGVEVEQTIGTILDEISVNPEKVPQGWTKDRFIEYKLQSAIIEADGFDIISMGRPEGAGCYCYVNNILRNIMSKLTADYDFVVIDNEAGLEHLSRRTTRSAEALLVVSDATKVGLRAAARIASIVKELGIKTKKNLLLVNRWQKNDGKLELENLKLDFIGNLGFDMEVAKLALNGQSLWELNKTALSLEALGKLGDKIWRLK